MLPTEAINRIRVLSERGMGSKAIAKSTGISRNTVRKYLSHFQTLTPISSEVQRPSRLDAFRDQIHEWFLACRGHCPGFRVTSECRSVYGSYKSTVSHGVPKNFTPKK